MSETDAIALTDVAERHPFGNGPRCPVAPLQGPKELVSAFTLLLLADSASHGYALARRLRSLGFEWEGSGPIYNRLRELQRRSSVRSYLTPGDSGPLRRTYALTPMGYAELEAYDESIDVLRHTLVQLLSAARGGQSAESPLRPRPEDGSAPARPGAEMQSSRTRSERTERRLGGSSTSEGCGNIGYPKEMVWAGILAIVSQAPSDARRITDGLDLLGFDWQASSPVDAHLHVLTKGCLLRWGTPTARRRHASRVYELTAAGRLAVPASVQYLSTLYSALTRWSEQYAYLKKHGRPTGFS